MAVRRVIQAHLLFLLRFACADTLLLQESCTVGDLELIEDGSCDSINNNENCMYDGGDCCECTVGTSLELFSVNNTYFCLDPSSGCLDSRVDMYPNCINGYIGDIANGQCDLSNNDEGCDFDGGDCCECTNPTGSPSNSETTDSFFHCVNPSSPCFDSALEPLESTCADGVIEEIGNGRCDTENNNQGCLYDGGDCCSCTCVDDTYYCGKDGYTCIDPDVAGLEDYVCVQWTDNRTSCPAEPKSEWIVENTTQAQALAEAVRCSHGVFNVTWIGKVVINETISIFDGTVLTVASDGEDAIIYGNGNTRLFAVVNASLYLRDITVGNGKAKYGGAIVASRSELSFNRVTFKGNNASSSGGALYLSNGATASFGEDTYFIQNIAFKGGAISLNNRSNASWTGNSTFSENISSSGGGGAIYLGESSNAVWTEASYFLSNRAFRGGGALVVLDGSSVLWTAASHFLGNFAYDLGGALSIRSSSYALWAGETFFSNNTANSKFGGALYVRDGSRAVWTASSHFLANSAGTYGGALCLEVSSTAEWAAASTFLANRAQSDGGAVYADDNVSLSWSGNILFEENSAENGGAIFVSNGVMTEWYGETTFISNNARSDGGAVGSRALDSELSLSSNGAASVLNDLGSTIAINGSTSFVNNTCDANGGGMALVQSLAVSFDSDNITFSGNYAKVSGGGVFIEGTAIGTVFTNVTFVRNSAQSGGGVHSTGSGTAVTIDGDSQVENPTTFVGCRFTENFALATGGAVDSASGKDIFSDTLFKGNKARVGGALRLAGTASVKNCLFYENLSELGGGPAVSNIGYMTNVTNSSFNNNIFDCENQTFLDFTMPDNIFETICNGCREECTSCSVDEGQGSPTCTSLSQAGVEHASSVGGTTTVEDLLVHEGYWRATTTSLNVYECFNTKACAGGITGSLNYCLQGYEGPYCSVCSKNYVRGLRFSCRECSDRTASMAIASVLAVLALACGIGIVSYLVSVEGGGTEQGIVDRIKRRVPMQPLKIIIVMWQIITQFASVANVTFPNVYEELLQGVEFLNFDLSWIMSIGCFVEVNFHDRLLWTTIAPLVTLGLLGGTYCVALARNRGSSWTTLRSARHKHVTMALLVTFLVYSNVSSVVFQTFACDSLDDGKKYLRADYTIECNSTKHRAFQVYAGLMILLYPVGIPALYAVLLFKSRHAFRSGKPREGSLVVMSTSSLWAPYTPQRFYYEVIECGRRILLAGVVVFIYPNSAAQVAVTLAIALFFAFLSEALVPYESHWDIWISRTGHAIVFASIYLVLLLKVDVSDENSSSQVAFEVTLVAAHGCMILAVLVEAVVMTVWLRVEKQVEDPRPRARPYSTFPWDMECFHHTDEADDHKNEM